MQKVIDACAKEHPDSARDRAVLLLLARLGLRAGDVAAMCLNDIDWTRARFRVTGKGRHEDWLPLPQDVGDAILAYLRDRRRVAGCDRVFLIARAPWGPLRGSSSVSAIVRRAMRRAGVSAGAGARGAHLLRHSAATEMLREGLSLPSIGVVLRHRCVETTAHYAKVDVQMLHSVAQPWLGAESC